MNRRRFVGTTLSSLAGIAALSKSLIADETPKITTDSSDELIKPKFLMPGDTVGIIAPSTAVTDPDDIRRAKEVLEYFGLKYKLGEHVLHGTGYKTRSIEERVSDLHAAFLDDEIRAVFAIRGGYGAPQLLDSIDYELIKKHPKILIGYSDITSLLLAIHKYSGLVTFHGPILLSAFSNCTIGYFKKALFSTNPIGITENAKDKNIFREVFPIRTVVPGKASGRLVGGNLTLVCNSLGTPYEIDTKGKILFIEDVGEEPYRIDRMLTQLRLANKFNDASGIVVGYCKGCGDDGLNTSRSFDQSLGEIVDNVFTKCNKPTIYGLTIGHTTNQFTLPLGVMAELDADSKILNITEAGVSA